MPFVFPNGYLVVPVSVAFAAGWAVLGVMAVRADRPVSLTAAGGGA